MKTIVAPVDFSPASITAAQYAADMARKIDAQLFLLHVCITPVAISEIPVAVENMNGVIDEAEREIRELKDKLSAAAGGSGNILTEVRTGHFISELQDFCESVKPDAVVVSLNSRGAVERFLFGSNTLQAVAGLTWPLLVVPSNASFTNICKIGLACDLQQVAETVPVDEIKDLVNRFHAALHVVHVCDQPAGENMRIPRKELGQLREMLKELSPVYHFMSREDIDAGISEFAAKTDLDLLIVIPRSHGLLGDLFHKSHTRHLLLHTQTPVLSIHE